MPSTSRIEDEDEFEYDDDNMEMYPVDSDGEEVIDDDSSEEEDTDLIRENHYRFTLLEGSSIAAKLQQQALMEWEKGFVYKKTFDIIDNSKKKLIELKITRNIERAIQDYIDSTAINRKYSSL